MRIEIADHSGWAVAVTASAVYRVVDRRRIELVEPGVTPAPIHYDSKHLDVARTAALVATVRSVRHPGDVDGARRAGRRPAPARPIDLPAGLAARLPRRHRGAAPLTV